MNLKDTIIEHYDFEAVSALVWKHLYSWYSADWCIMRYLRRDRVNKRGLVLDLYPETSGYTSFIDDDEYEEDASNEEGELSKPVKMLDNMTVPEILKNIKI